MAAHTKIISFIAELRKSIRNLALAFFLLCPGDLFSLAASVAVGAGASGWQTLFLFRGWTVSGPCETGTFCRAICFNALVHPGVMAIPWQTFWRLRRATIFLYSLYLSAFFTLEHFSVIMSLCHLVLNFLLGFGSEELKPVISVGEFVNFTTIFILAFGLIFELPIFMVFSGQGWGVQTTFL